MTEKDKGAKNKIKLDSKKLEKLDKKEIILNKKPQTNQQEKKEIENPFAEKNKFDSASVIDIPAPVLQTTPLPTPTQTSQAPQQNLENIAEETPTPTETQAPAQNLEGTYVSGYQPGRATERTRNIPHYSSGVEGAIRVEQATRSTTTPTPNERPLQRVQFQDPSIRNWNGADRTSEYYSTQEKPSFARQDMNDPNVQSASRGKRDIDLRDYEI